MRVVTRDDVDVIANFFKENRLQYQTYQSLLERGDYSERQHKGHSACRTYVA